jgi:hypothetical protein
MRKVFIDSDVMLDLSLKREPFYLPALNLFELCYKSHIKGTTSSVAFVNTNYFLDRFAPATRSETLKKLRRAISIIEVGEAIIDLALKSDFIDFEDAVQHFAAISAKADVIITRNIKDYKHSTIPVLTAEQFLKTL